MPTPSTTPKRRHATLIVPATFALVLALSGFATSAGGGFANIHAHGTYPGSATVTAPTGWRCDQTVTPSGGDVVCFPPQGEFFCNWWSVSVKDTLSGPLTLADSASVQGWSKCGSAPWATCTAGVSGATPTNFCSSTVFGPAPTPIWCRWLVAPPTFPVDTLTYDVDCNYG